MNGLNRLVLHYNRVEMLVRNKHSSLLDLFVSYTKNDVLWIRTVSFCTQHFIFFVSYEWVQLAWTLNYARLERLARNKQFSLLGTFVSYKINEVLWIRLLLLLLRSSCRSSPSSLLGAPLFNTPLLISIFYWLWSLLCSAPITSSLSLLLSPLPALLSAPCSSLSSLLLSPLLSLPSTSFWPGKSF